MLWFGIKIGVSALTISLCSWLAGRMPHVAGFIIALPLNTLLVLLFTQSEYNDPQKSVLLARGIFSGIFVSMLFFVPFLLADKFRLGFWTCYLGGLALLAVGYLIHTQVGRLFSA